MHGVFNESKSVGPEADCARSRVNSDYRYRGNAVRAETQDYDCSLAEAIRA
jgi:hypothetical protein